MAIHGGLDVARAGGAAGALKCGRCPSCRAPSGDGVAEHRARRRGACGAGDAHRVRLACLLAQPWGHRPSDFCLVDGSGGLAGSQSAVAGAATAHDRPIDYLHIRRACDAGFRNRCGDPTKAERGGAPRCAREHARLPRRLHSGGDDSAGRFAREVRSAFWRIRLAGCGARCGAFRSPGPARLNTGWRRA